MGSWRPGWVGDRFCEPGAHMSRHGRWPPKGRHPRAGGIPAGEAAPPGPARRRLNPRRASLSRA